MNNVSLSIPTMVILITLAYYILLVFGSTLTKIDLTKPLEL